MWQFFPKSSKLAKDEVHVWRADLDLPQERIEELAAMLSADEKVRANRFYFERDKHRFIAGRGILRNILSLYSSIEPHLLHFEYGPRGKPRLAGNVGLDLEFNLSHSQGLALYGLTLNNQIGIDLEYLRSIPNACEIARRFFSPTEYASFACLSEPERQRAFFSIWTAKEAYLKATGDGLSGALDRIEISLSASDALRLLSVEGDCKVAAGWYLSPIVLEPEYIATLAVSSFSPSINVKHFAC